MSNPNSQPFVITIGRQFGSGGRYIGRQLATRLGIAYYDKELLTEAALASGLDPEFFKRNDERHPKYFSGQLSFTMGMSHFNLFQGSLSISDEAVYRAQSDFIRSIAARQACVIVGRTADYVLRDNDRLISLFIHAPIEHRVRRIMEREPELTMQQAKTKALKNDKLRAGYYNFYTDRTWGDSATYHLSIDTSKGDMDSIVDLLSRYVEMRLKDF